MSFEKLTSLMPAGDPPRYAPPSLFRTSPTQPRSRTKPEKIAELRASIVLTGQLQAALARPNPDFVEGNGMPPFELVFGHQRAEAVAGIEDGPGLLVNVRELTDHQVMQIQMIENMDREDLHPLDEAKGLQRLLRPPEGGEGFANVDDLAAWLGKSRRWVYKRLSLTRLCDKAREAFLEDKINASVATLLARMQDPDQQAAATERILIGWGGDPLSVRAAADVLQKEFMLDLGSAPFDIHAAFEVAGPCGQCPKRSGANPDLFDEITSGDMCQDNECFQAKAAEHRVIVLSKAEESGHRVLRGDDAKKLMPWKYNTPYGYFDADEPCTQLSDSERPLREHFGKKPPELVVLEHPDNLKIITLVKRDDAEKVLKAKRLLREPKSPSAPGAGANESSKPERVKPRPAHELKYLTEELAAAKFGLQAATLIRDRLRSLDVMPIEVARVAAFHALADLSEGSLRILFALQGWDLISEDEWEETSEEVIAAHLDGLVEAGAIGTLGELMLQAQFVDRLDAQWHIARMFDPDERSATRDIAKALGVFHQLEPMLDAAREEAEEAVQAEEDERLGRTKPQDATEAFVEAHAPTSEGKTAKRSPAKYRNAATGETWSGRGLQPKWLKVAIEGGAKLEDFEVTA